MRLSFLLIALAGLVLVVMPPTVEAALLIEARRESGAPMRIVADRAQQRVLLSAGGARILVDLAAGYVYQQEGNDPARRAHARFRPGHDRPPPYRIEPFGPGPLLAGHGSAYHVLFAEDRVCAELMLSAWMRPFVDPVVRALALLEPPPDPADPCGRIPFTTYGAAGWPLLAGKIDHPTFATTALRFDYDPGPDELAPPARFTDVSIEELIAASRH